MKHFHAPQAPHLLLKYHGHLANKSLAFPQKTEILNYDILSFESSQKKLCLLGSTDDPNNPLIPTMILIGNRFQK